MPQSRQSIEILVVFTNKRQFGHIIGLVAIKNTHDKLEKNKKSTQNANNHTLKNLFTLVE
jgi:hypothetical protein